MKGIFKILLALFCVFIAANCSSKNEEGQIKGESRIIAKFSKGSAYFYYNPPTLVGGAVYIGTSKKLHEEPADDNYFFKLDMDLQEIWSYSLGSDEVRGPAALDSKMNIYFVVESGRTAGEGNVSDFYLYSLSNDGELKWFFPLGSIAANIGMTSPAVSEDDIIYIAGVSKAFAINPDGTEKWDHLTSGSGLMHAPVIDTAGNVYFFAGETVYSLQSDDGVEKWSTPVDEESQSVCPAFTKSKERIILACNNKIVALRLSDGAKQWEFTPPNMDPEAVFRASPVIDQNGTIYLGTKLQGAGVLYAINADGSSLVWEKDFHADLYSTPAIGDDSKLYLGSEHTGTGNRFHAVDMSNGNIEWSIELPSDITWSSAVLSDEGYAYIGCMDGYIYKTRTDSTGLMMDAAWPRFHGSNENHGRLCE